VRGATTLARSAGVSPLAIGLTVVALGTSAPELAVNLSAALRGSTAISFGNVIGSNLANMGLVVGAVAVLHPLAIETVVVRREIPMMLLATGVAIALGLDTLLNGAPDAYSRGDSLVLLMVFLVFIYYVSGDIRAQREDRYVKHVEGRAPAGRESRRSLVALAWVALGVAALVWGARLTVGGATGMARSLGVSEALIGLTLVAVGTSLPELTASMVAALRGHTDLAVGNVVGSNVLNLLLVLGLTGLVHPIPIPSGGDADLVVAGAFSVLLLRVATTYGHRIVRWEGALLLAGYLGYVVFRVLFFA
jgi:cation:H+ antiporter